jgi:hypothetical protein
MGLSEDERSQDSSQGWASQHLIWLMPESIELHGSYCNWKEERVNRAEQDETEAKGEDGRRSVSPRSCDSLYILVSESGVHKLVDRLYLQLPAGFSFSSFRISDSLSPTTALPLFQSTSTGLWKLSPFSLSFLSASD